jgi:hypothetical protein
MFKRIWTTICELFGAIFERYIELDMCEEKEEE